MGEKENKILSILKTTGVNRNKSYFLRLPFEVATLQGYLVRC